MLVRYRLRWVLVLSLAVVVLAGCDWLQPGYDSGGSRANPSEPALTTSSVANLVSRFSISATDRSYGAPIVAHAAMYATSLDPSTGTARVEQFDAASGARGWSTTLASGVDAVGDASSDGTSAFVVTFVTQTGAETLFAVSLSTGEVEWIKTLPTSGHGVLPVRVDQGRVFVTLWQPGVTFAPWGAVDVLAVNSATGATEWSYTNSVNVVQSIGTVVAENLVVIAFDCCARPGLPQGIPTTVVLNENDGSLRTEIQNGQLTVAADRLAYGQMTDPTSGQPETVAVDPTNGTMKWSAPLTTDFAVNGSSMVSVVTGGILQAVDSTTGSAQWTSPAPTGANNTTSDPVIAGGVVYLVVGDGGTNQLRTYNATNGTAIGILSTGTGTYTDPVVADGTVYVSQGGTITAYRPQ